MNKQQEEILRILQEECGEVVQMISKCCRFGLDETHLKAGEPNRQRLTEELGDLQCMLDLAVSKGIVSRVGLDVAAFNKIEKLKTWSNIFKE